MAGIVRCYVEQRGADWEGVCIDFDLAVQGHSFEEIQERLLRAIQEYVAYVHTLPEAEQERFLNRRVPFWTRFEFAALALISMLRRGPRNGNIDHLSYTLPCAA